ncbi:MAG: DUF1549 domain-containing protein [Pirellulales bacterium]
MSFERAFRRGVHSTLAVAVSAVVLLVAIAVGTNTPGTVSTALAAPSDSRAATSGADADYGIPQVKFINEQIRAGWAAHNLTPSKEATDGEWCRRVYLDILGRIPSVVELDAYLKDRSADKKLKLVNRLLSSEHQEEYTRNWTAIWTNILIGRNGGMEENSLTNRDGMQKYLRDSLARNKTYDKMVHELISATGDTAPGAESFNGATNFIAGKLEENGSQATAKTAQIFLGLQIQCTQCHNHPFNDWKQNRYWELNAFFRQTRALRSFVRGTDDIRAVRLINEDFGGEGNPPNAEEADIYYELRNGLVKVAYPVFVDGTEIGKSGYVDDVVRREKLADLVVQSEYMPKVMANRMWGHFLGYGFTKPVDDLGPHNAASHPELLDYLGKEFAKNSFDVKTLIRWIVLSEPYGLSSRGTPGNKADDPLLGEKPQFTHFYLRQLSAEELYASLLVATAADKAVGSYEEREKEMREWMRQFVFAFGNDEGEETTTFNGTIPQALMMMNGDLIQKAVNCEKGSFLHTVAMNDNLAAGAKINYLFTAALARQPSGNELAVANKLYAARGNDTAAALQDIWWAVLNSNEFILNH